ncbi:MAG TPA: hypothetical protein VFO79_16490 [Xanthomonadales bacterium]|nr:hypothetical protein [Xanthomonadales bacterium]
MNRRAVGYGVLGGVAVVAFQYAIAFLAPLDGNPWLVPYVVAINQFLSIAGYVIAGAIAGNFAGTRGALHGLAAGIGTAVVGRAFGIALAVVRYGAAAVEAMWESIEVLIVWLLISLTIATVAGSVAVRVRAGSQRRAR